MAVNLILCHYSHQTCPQSVIDSIHRLQVGLGHATKIVNIYPIDLKVELNSLFARETNIVVHPTLAYSLDALLRFQPVLCKKIRSLNGIKVVLRQDETTACASFIDAARYLKITHIYGCLSDQYAYSVYGCILQSVAYRKIFTAYLTPRIRELATRTLQDNHVCQTSKNLDLSYVGADNPITFGSLTIDKYKLVNLINAVLSESAFVWTAFNRHPLNPQSSKWQEILLRSKVHLSVPSGGSSFSYWNQAGDNTMISDYLSSNKPLDIFIAHQLKFLDNVVPYGQIAPRHLEAIASGCILGVVDVNSPYSMEPLVEGIHYIKIQPDLGNLAEVLSRFQDISVRKSFSSIAINTLLDMAVLQESSLYHDLISDFNSNTRQHRIVFYRNKTFNNLLFSTWLSEQLNACAIASTTVTTDDLKNTRDHVSGLKTIATLRHIVRNCSDKSLLHANNATSPDISAIIYQLLDLLADALQRPAPSPSEQINASDTYQDVNPIHNTVISILEIALLESQKKENIGFSPPSIIIVSDYTMLFAALLSRHLYGSQVLFYATSLPCVSHSSLAPEVSSFYQSFLHLASPLLLGIFASTRLLASSISLLVNRPVIAALTPAPINLKLLHSVQLKYQPSTYAPPHDTAIYIPKSQPASNTKSVLLLDDSLKNYLTEVFSAWESSSSFHKLYIIPVNMALYELAQSWCTRPNYAHSLKARINILLPVPLAELPFKLLDYDIALLPQISHRYSVVHQSYLIRSLLMSAGLPILSISLDVSNNTVHHGCAANQPPQRLPSTSLATQLCRLDNAECRSVRAYSLVRHHSTHLNWNQQAAPLFNVIKQSLYSAHTELIHISPLNNATNHILASFPMTMLRKIYHKLASLLFIVRKSI